MWLYKEDDWVAEVEILEDFSDQNREGYKLKVVKTIQESNLRQPRPHGYTFTCWKERHADPIYTRALWQLDKVGGRSSGLPFSFGEMGHRVLRFFLHVTLLAVVLDRSRRIPADS
jgi:hypothetical protein